MAIPSFVDRVTLTVTAGHGGNGCASVHREKFKPLGGPDGGNGGDGGSIILKVEPGLTTLVDYHRHSQRSAGNGQPGMGDNRQGAAGAAMILPVPPGTVVTDLDSGERLADLISDNDQVVIAQGGRGGLGNATLATSTHKAPGFALLGGKGQSRRIRLELKVVADVGLVGFPSAGKSSLIAAISRARPKVADYPFTTLVPNLGVVKADNVTFTVADVPGLIEGASEGKGLGHDFLRHIERCQAIVHVIDCATYLPGRDPISDLDVIESELSHYGGLADRPRLVALNKIDVPDAKTIAELARPEIERRGWPVFEISTKTGEGLTELRYAMAGLVARQRDVTEVKPTVPVIVPKAAQASEFTVTKRSDDRGGFVWWVKGAKPERWIEQTDFANDEAVGYLADRLARLGVEDELARLGAVEGDAVAIGPADDAVVFDFAPQVASDPVPLTRRGLDARLQSTRPARQRRQQRDVDYQADRAEMMSQAGRDDWRTVRRQAVADAIDDEPQDE